MKAATTFIDFRAKDGVSVWENEGGSLAAAKQPAEPSFIEKQVTPSQTPPVSNETSTAEQRDADRGVADTHTLTIMRVSLLLLVPVLGALAVFWASIATLAP